MSDLILERDGALATVSLDRPAVRNALNPSLIGELTDLFGRLAGDPELRVIVLTGAGDVFCAGADVGWMRDSRDLSQQDNAADAAALAAMFDAIDRCPKPVIARVNGSALGGGAGLVACADLAIAARTAGFAFSEARLGLIPAVISPYVLRRIGPGATRALFVTARRFTAEEAARLGLVDDVVAAGDLDAAVRVAAEGLLFCAPEAIAECKRLVREASAGLALGDLPERIAAARSSAEGQEGLTAFLEKRRPAWAPSEPSS